MGETARARFHGFKDRCRSGELVVGTICATMSPAAVEILGYAGNDFVLIDTELLLINPETVENMVRAAECAGAVPIVKVRENLPLQIEDAFVSGAPAVMVPHIVSADSLRKAMDASFFPPKGKRGLCVVSRANQYGQGKMGDLIEWTNREAMVIPIIEDKEAIDRIDEIMAVEGVEIYELGPADLSNSYGRPPDQGLANPEVAAAFEKILEAARKHGKRVITVPNFGREVTPEFLKERLFDRGVTMLCLRPDSVMLGQTVRNALKVREAFKR